MTELVAAYRQGVGVNDLAASFGVNRTTVLGHVRRQGVPKRTRRRLHQDDLTKVVRLYLDGRSEDRLLDRLRGTLADPFQRIARRVSVVGEEVSVGAVGDGD